jgi:7,8-dihydropterin-6-yl-methyl-4-(beta-D-ribofuranosyl)aminobenzene 5'-phosphate synthase
MVISVLYDNYEGRKGLRTAWGFSCLVEGFDQTVLFDTGGDGDILLRNMRAMAVVPKEIDALVLSHAHWDHTGGLAAFLGHNPEVTVYMPESFPADLKNTVRESGSTLPETDRPTGICAGLSTTPVLGEAIPEQGLRVEGTEGGILITGCAHPGITEMAEAAGEVSESGIDAVMGGFHLKDEWNTEINRIVAELKDLGVRRVGPCHCSGDAARGKMASAFGDGYLDVSLGTRLEWRTPKGPDCSGT